MFYTQHKCNSDTLSCFVASEKSYCTRKYHLLHYFTIIIASNISAFPGPGTGLSICTHQLTDFSLCYKT